MKVNSATKQQLKNIIEWDNHCPVTLLSRIFEEAVNREVHKPFVIRCIIKFFGSKEKAEKSTKMTMDELKWLCYEKGFEALKIFNPGNRPFIALWSDFVRKALSEEARTHKAQKRTAEIISIDKVGDWILPHSHYNTEKTVINRIEIQHLLSQMKDTEKQIALKRYEGYTLEEIAAVQGITRSGIQRRIKTYLKKLRGIRYA